MVLDLRPEVVSFTFGLPTAAECERLRDAGITTVGTVTTLPEAEMAVALRRRRPGRAGPVGGRPSRHVRSRRAARGRSVTIFCWAASAIVDVPVVAAGGLATADDIGRVIRAGAVAAQLGTAFLLADEAGSSPVHRAASAGPAVHRNGRHQSVFRPLRARTA